jgi:uncharacterized phiE125 gp8 family phage protein
MTPILIAPPGGEPLTLAEAKAWLRLDSQAEDALVSALIGAARLAVEAASGRRLITQTWRLVRDAWPPDGVIRVPVRPFAGVVGLRVIDAAGAPIIVAPSLYAADIAREPGEIRLVGAPPQPGRATSGIEIDVTAGYGPQPQDVPEPLRQAVRLLVARWFENRGDGVMSPDHLPAEVAALIAPFRRARL